MLYAQDIDACFADRIGGAGVERAVFEAELMRANDALRALGKGRRDDPLLTLVERHDDLAALADTVAEWRQQFDDVLVLGTGGSSLGAQALIALARPPTGPSLHFVDTLDADDVGHLVDRLNWARTGVLAISKSGSTPETMAVLLVAIQALQNHGDAADTAGRILAIADPGDSPLRRLATAHGFPVIDHEAAIGGRFSVLTPVGLLPAMLAGQSAEAVRAGAKAALEAALSADLPAPAAGAALNTALTRQRGIVITVLMPYVARLERFALWYRQLWAESLGKGGHGTLPVRALGPVDQHSQLQLYLDGPNDKLFTLILPPDLAGPRVDPGLTTDDDLAYLGGHSLGQLTSAQAKATAETLSRSGRPARTIQLDSVDEATLGALFMHFLLETLIAARLIGVNPFGQPAVDEGKRLARLYLADMALPQEAS